MAAPFDAGTPEPYMTEAAFAALGGDFKVGMRDLLEQAVAAVRAGQRTREPVTVEWLAANYLDSTNKVALGPVELANSLAYRLALAITELAKADVNEHRDH
jgi:hypothetical protein